MTTLQSRPSTSTGENFNAKKVIIWRLLAQFRLGALIFSVIPEFFLLYFNGPVLIDISYNIQCVFTYSPNLSILIMHQINEIRRSLCLSYYYLPSRFMKYHLRTTDRCICLSREFTSANARCAIHKISKMKSAIQVIEEKQKKSSYYYWAVITAK